MVVPCGELAEWFKALVSKTSDGNAVRAFESLTLRHFYAYY